MNTNVFKIIALAAFLLLFAAALYIYRPSDERLTRITVVGESESKIQPDTAIITFAVVTQSKHAVDAQQQNAAKSEAVKKAVQAITTDTSAEIKTSN